MKPKIYIASGLSNYLKVKFLARILTSDDGYGGWELTYDWTQHGKIEHTDHAAQVAAINEVTGVLGADLLLVLLPGGRGTHAELGVALARGALAPIPIFVFGSDEQLLAGSHRCIFYSHPAVTIIQDTEVLLTTLQKVRDELCQD